MISKDDDMRAIFCELSEKNKDIVILIAKSMKIAQDTVVQTQDSAFSHNATEQ